VFSKSKFPTGELPLSVIKMKTQGVKVQLDGNTGFTLPSNIGDLGDTTKLNLYNCSLIGGVNPFCSLAWKMSL
jgi:hypothetical protein